MSNSYNYLRSDTGEVVGQGDTHKIRSIKQIEAAKKYNERRDEELEAYRKIDVYKRGQYLTLEDANNIIAASKEKRKSGSYTQYFREAISDDPATVARFFLMCTYLDFETEYLVVKSNGTYMTKSDLRRKMRLKEKTFLEFYSEMESKNIICLENNYIKINPSYSRRGGSNIKNLAIIRCFDKPIQKLFEAATPRQHKHIGYILMLLPYMNKYNNFLCKIKDLSDEEELKSTIYNRKEGLEFLSMKDICNMIGYDISNMARLRKELCSIKVDDEFLFAFVLTGSNEYLPVINDVFFFGSDWCKKSELHNRIFKSKND